MSGSQIMCPHCGKLFVGLPPQVPTHDYPPPCRSVCPGSGQVPRNPESDARLLWNGEPNPWIKES